MSVSDITAKSLLAVVSAKAAAALAADSHRLETKVNDILAACLDVAENSKTRLEYALDSESVENCGFKDSDSGSDRRLSPWGARIVTALTDKGFVVTSDFKYLTITISWDQIDCWDGHVA